MNELTKEEMQFLYDELADMVDKSSIKGEQQPNIVYGIKHKLAFLIADYCEHEHLKDVGAEYKVCRGCAEEIYE